MKSFENRVVVVTGGTRGIGAAISKEFIDSGAKVIATYVSNDDAAQKMRTELGDNFSFKKFNVSSSSEVNDFFGEVETEFGQVDILVNNSGVRKDQILASMTEDQWDDVLDINLKGTYLMSKGAVLLMMKNRFGRIINISSMSGVLGLSGQANYSASKAGQIALAKVLSKEVAKRGITVNTILPGFIETDLISNLDDDLVKSYKKDIPMRRFGKASEVAKAVSFLASEDASYITGSTLEISGGL